MLSVALTGNIASGKSTVLDWLARWGAATTDADAIVHELQRPGTPVFAAIVERFGRRVVQADGSLHRVLLRSLVFNDDAARRDLERIVHPAVRARQAEAAQTAREGAAPVIVHDIPLLFESGDPALFDRVVLVDAPEALRRDRLVRLRGLDPELADRLIAAQLPAESKRARSHYTIDNHGDLDLFEARTRSVWEALLGDARGRA